MKYLCCLCALLYSLVSFGQSAVIKGEVYDDIENEPLIGATILVKGTSIGIVTDFDGQFQLNVKQELPVILVFSYVGYESKEMEVSDASTPIKVRLGENAITAPEIEVVGQRISDKQKAAPLTVESMDLLAIKETPSDNFYDGLGSLKGVDITAASLGFKIVNTRGFNSTSPVRSLQIIDGVDNQAPGLNFSLGNFLGSSELDVLKVDMIQGAASAFYGPNAFNGVISMETKNPFYQKGLSALVKVGERNLVETAVRWADVVSNKDGNEVFGYKVNLSYLRADDWVADNFDPVFDTETGTDNPGRFDAVNIYGDEYFRGNDFSSNDPWVNPGLGIFHRTGYREEDLVDYDTRNLKANAALHFRLNPAMQDESPELVVSGSFGSGTTVYQGDNRFSLKDITFVQPKISVHKRGKWFVRSYMTQTTAGDSYDPYFTALLLLDSVKSNLDWSEEYLKHWTDNYTPRTAKLGYPQVQISVDDMGNIVATFDNDAANQWLNNFQDTLASWHAITEAVVNAQTSGTTQAFLEPGTERFEAVFNDITSRSRNDGGTRFIDRSRLYHIQGEYKFE
ncbi:MAG: carboxypeptidase-like regulatory domain-containing protein, partial [Bacteroidota bacterium]